MEKINELTKKISDNLNADIFIFNGQINYKNIDKFIWEIKKIKDKKKNLYLILTTFGGDPDAAYRLVSYVKNIYNTFYLFVMGFCKSAGTIIALGADEIIFSDFGELGPLDVQISKEDELTQTSGLALRQALMLLRDEAFSMFEEYFLKLKQRSGGLITTKTAAEISSSLVIGLLSPIFAHIEPLRLGENERSMKIAYEYGIRICDNSELIMNLVTGYVSHSFVIDFNEASRIFKNVRKLNKLELELENKMYKLMRLQHEDEFIARLPQEIKAEDDNDGKEKNKNGNRNGTTKANSRIKRKVKSEPETTEDKEKKIND